MSRSLIARRSRRALRGAGKRTAVLTAVLLVATCSTTHAQAADPLASADRLEPAFLPVLAGDTDIGFKFGVFSQLARFREGSKPYAWRAQALLATSVMEGASGTEFPYREAFLKLDLPQLGIGPIRLIVEVSYFRATNRGYYGLGNAADASRLWAGLQEGTDEYVQARWHYQFDATTPAGSVKEE